MTNLLDAVAPVQLTVERLRAAYRSGEATPKQIIESIILRAASDAPFKTWITPPSMERIAPYLERLNEFDPEQTPLWGIPFAVKDNIDVAGWPTTAGCAEYAYTPDRHAAVVARLIEAGAIPVGKANLDQFATGLVGTRSPYGETHNALRPELISGGSSSGSAVAVARGHAAFALGTDTAGSGRVPAALNGLVGWKPSIGAWPTLGVVPACASLDCVTVFAHSVEDSLAVDRVVRGLDMNDPWSRDYQADTLRPQQPTAILLPQEEPLFYGPYSETYREAWHRSVAAWERLGIPVERIDTAPLAEAAAILYEGPWVAERWAGLGGFIEANPGAALPVTERILRSGAAGSHDAAALFRAQHRLQQLKLQTKQLLNGAVLLLPTCGGTWTRKDAAADPIGANTAMGRYTNHCNLLDLCAVALPAGAATDDVPFGVTLFAPAGNESLLLGAVELYSKTGAAEGAAESSFARSQAAAAPSPLDTTLVAVCGLHMQGYPLEKQMIASGALFIRRTLSAPRYQFVKLPTEPAKPGMIKLPSGGAAIELELWEMPLAALGPFAASIPAPLGIGKVELQDGTEVPGFICEGYAAMLGHAEDISSAGGWRNVSPLAAH